MKRKPPALRTIGIDLDGRAIEAFRCDYEVELVHGCAHRFLGGFPFDGSELVYSDPPYLRSTRKSDRRYRHDYEEADHEALLALLKALPCAAMVSGYPSALYDDRLGGWGSVSLQAMNRAGVVTEKVWFNFKPDRLHWARYPAPARRRAAGSLRGAVPAHRRGSRRRRRPRRDASPGWPGTHCAGWHGIFPLTQDQLPELLDPGTPRRRNGILPPGPGRHPGGAGPCPGAAAAAGVHPPPGRPRQAGLRATGRQALATAPRSPVWRTAPGLPGRRSVCLPAGLRSHSGGRRALHPHLQAGQPRNPVRVSPRHRLENAPNGRGPGPATAHPPLPLHDRTAHPRRTATTPCA